MALARCRFAVLFNCSAHPSRIFSDELSSRDQRGFISRPVSCAPTSVASLSSGDLAFRHLVLQIMGGFGSGRYGGGPTVESTFRIDIGPYHDLDVECETHIGGPWNDWVRLKYEMRDYWTGEPLK